MKRLIIVGNGKMAEAIVRGLCQKMDLTVVARDVTALEKMHALCGGRLSTKKLDEGVSIEGENVLLAVKPYALEAVAEHLKGRANALFSILAGTAIEQLVLHIRAAHYVRMMPNLAAAYGASMTTLCGDEKMKKEAMEIAEGIGRALWLESEKEIDIATAIAGSGPAFLAMVAEALADGGVKEGLGRHQAMELVQGLFEGMGPLLEHYHPALLKDAVMSPGGTTAAGYAKMESKGVREGCIEAVGAAYRRTKGE
ncbi:MAG: pyrroline-5-carboxylate reductase [Campylobacteraceae bacterium 4484_4]|nr:MAG: pyrroline-5-carboxylate reductase [Campylobacteraceae bacterium 4484_4]